MLSLKKQQSPPAACHPLMSFFFPIKKAGQQFPSRTKEHFSLCTVSWVRLTPSRTQGIYFLMFQATSSKKEKKRTYISFLQGLKYVVPFPLTMSICSVKAIDIAKLYIYKKMVTHKNLYSHFAIPGVQYSLSFPSSTHPYPLTLLYFDESFRLKFHSTFSRILTTSASIHIKVHLVSNLHYTNVIWLRVFSLLNSKVPSQCVGGAHL